MSIKLHIERLVIDEAVLGGERASSVRAAIERELTVRFSQAGAIDSLRRIGAVDYLPPAPLLAARRSRDPLGRRIAAAVGEGIGIGHQGMQPAMTGNPDIGRQR